MPMKTFFLNKFTATFMADIFGKAKDFASDSITVILFKKINK